MAIAIKPASPRLRRSREASQLYAAWPLASRGSPARDHVGRNDLALVGGATWTAGPDGPAVNLDGTSGYLRSAAGIFSPATRDFTAIVAFTLAALPTGAGQASILAEEDGTGTGRSWAYAISTGQLATNLAGAVTVGPTVLTLGTPHQVAIVGRAGSTWAIYLDGNPTPEISLAGAQNAATGSLVLGAAKTHTLLLAGSIRWAVLESRALSAAEILRRWAAPFRIWNPRRRGAESSSQSAPAGRQPGRPIQRRWFTGLTRNR